MCGDEFMSEARAKIIWGEPPSSVRGFLVSSGVSGAVADAKVAEFCLERNRELRKIGFRDFLIGVVLTVAAGMSLYMGISLGAVSSGWIRTLALVLLAGLYGLWKLGKGVIYLTRPQSVHKSIPDIEESDILE